MTLVACLVHSGCPLDPLPLPRHVKPYRQSGSILTVGSSTSATSGPSDGSSSSRPRARIGPPVDPTVSFNPNAQFLCLFDETRRPCAKRGCKERCARCNVPWTVRADLATDQWCANVPKKGLTSYIQVWCAAPGTPSCTESNQSGDLALPHHRPDPHRRTISSSPSCTRPISSLAHELQPSGGVSEVSQDIQSAAKGRVRFPRRYIQLVLRANDAWMGGKSPIHPMRMAE